MAWNLTTVFLVHNKQQEALAVLIGKDDHKILRLSARNHGISQEKAEAVSKEKGAGEIDKDNLLVVIKTSQSGKSSQALIFI